LHRKIAENGVGNGTGAPIAAVVDVTGVVLAETTVPRARRR
jgi:hypothetical protein